MLELAKLGESLGVAVETENWHALLSGPDQVTRLMELTNGSIGFKLDFGNWPNNRKYIDLPKVAPYATSTHAKAHYDGDKIDVEDFLRCCDICKDAGFTGPHVLVYDGPGDEWERLREIGALTLPYLAPAQSV